MVSKSFFGGLNSRNIFSTPAVSVNHIDDSITLAELIFLLVFFKSLPKNLTNENIFKQLNKV